MTRISRITCIAAVAVATAAAAARAEVPPPSAMRAKIVVNGRTSTAIEIPIQKVGQEIPKTYAGSKIANAPGFEFWVSEHFALRTNMGEAYAKAMLEVSELAHPHWVATVGSDVPDPETRMFITCADNTANLLRAMVADIGMGPLGGFAGGFTASSNKSAYNYPSGTLQYHQRALVIHENLHMLNMIANGTSGTEGPTYAGQLHVYDPAKKQLTVFCFDIAPAGNYIDAGLAALHKQFIPMNEAVRRLWTGGRDEAAVYQQFFLTDPDRNLKWRIWRDEFYAGNVSDATNKAVMEGIFGPLERLDEDWTRWVRDHTSTFHYVDWGWEQEADTLWAYGFPGDKRYWSQTDIQLAPGEKAAYDPLRMDWPTGAMSPLVGPIGRGGAEPAVGCEVWNVAGAAWGGLGLGVEGRDMCRVILAHDKKLVIDGRSFGIAPQEVPLTPEVAEAAAKNGGRYGLTMQIKEAELAVTVRAGAAAPFAEMTATAPLDAAQRKRLLEKPMAIIGRDGFPRVTPWVDDARRPWPDLAQPAPANRWRFAGMEKLETLYRAAWRLGDKAPQSLRTLKSEMLLAVDARPQAQADAIEEYEDRIGGIIRDVKNCSAAPATKARALADLAGVFLQVDGPRGGSRPDLVAMTCRATARLGEPVACAVSVAADGTPLKQERPPATTLVALRPLEQETEVPAKGGEPLEVTHTFALEWRGESIEVPLERTVHETSVPRWHVIGPFDNPGGAPADVKHPVESEPVDLAKRYPGQGGEAAWRLVERPATLPVLAEHMVDLNAVFGPRTNAAAYALVWIEADKPQEAVLALGSDDGAVVWLDGREVHRTLVPRAHRSRGDTVKLPLVAGRNALLVKVTQGVGGWQLSAHLTGADGKALEGVRLTTDPPAS